MKILSTFDHYSYLSLFLDRGLLASKVPTLAWYFTLNYRSALCKGLSMKYVRWDVKSFARRTWEKLEVSISCDIVGDAASSLSTDWEGKAKLLLFRFSGKGKLCKCAQCTASRKCCLLYFFAIAPFPPPCKGDQKNIAYNNDSLKSWIFPLYARVIKSMTVSGFPSWQKNRLTVEFKDNGISRKKLTRENRHHVLQKCSYSFPIHDTVFPQYSIWNRATSCLQEATILEELLVTPAHVARPLAPAHPLLLPLHHPLQALRHLHHPLPHRHCLCPWRGARGQPGEFFWELIRDPSQQWLLGKDRGPAQTFGEMCKKKLIGSG